MEQNSSQVTVAISTISITYTLNRKRYNFYTLLIYKTKLKIHVYWKQT